jgi:hypothetical protein
MSVLPSKPDMLRTGIDVRFVPEADFLAPLVGDRDLTNFA